MSFYDLVTQLYAALNDGEITKAREILSSFIKKGGDKKFLAETLKTVAIAKMAGYLFDEVESGIRSKREVKVTEK